VLQAFVYGDSYKAQLVAVVVPDPEVLLPWARERNLPQVRARHAVCVCVCVCVRPWRRYGAVTPGAV
jgi:long-subunit acyl-CoA synthetase (AMP-forming)